MGQNQQRKLATVYRKMKQGLLGRNGADAEPQLDKPGTWHVDKLLNMRLGSRFHRYPSPEAPWQQQQLCEYIQQLPPLSQPTPAATAPSDISSVGSASATEVVPEPRSQPTPAATVPSDIGSVGSATELVGSSSSSSTIFTTSRVEPQQYPPRSKARPAQKPSAKVFC